MPGFDAAFIKQFSYGLQGFWQVILKGVFRVFFNQVENILVSNDSRRKNS